MSGRHRRIPRAGKSLWLGIAAAACLGVAAAGYVALVLWPRWPEPSAVADAPSLPITIAGVAFNVPPAAIRMPVQRRPGAQPRLDLAFLWPDLTPPGAGKPASSEDPRLLEQIFVSIAGADGALSFGERIKTIYPRYVEALAFRGPEGLLGVAFREGTPYQGEDLFFVAERPDSFIVRCTRETGATRGSCLYERRIDGVDLTVRFPRDWLKDWQKLADGVDHLVAMLRAGTS